MDLTDIMLFGKAINGGEGGAAPMGEALTRTITPQDDTGGIFTSVILPNYVDVDDAIDVMGMQFIHVSSVEDAKIGMEGICLVNFGVTSETTSVRKYSRYENIDGDSDGGLVTGISADDAMEFIYISKAMFDQFTEEGDNPFPSHGLYIAKEIAENATGIFALVSWGIG